MNSALSSGIDVKVEVGKHQVFASGVVHLENETQVKISIANIKLVFEFKSDNEAPRYTGYVRDGVLHIDLYNHSNSLGEGKLTPIEIGTLNGRKLFFTYFAHTVVHADSARRFEYVFYLGEPV